MKIDFCSDRNSGNICKIPNTVLRCFLSMKNKYQLHLAASFPERCPDNNAICGFDEGSFDAQVLAFIPYLQELQFFENVNRLNNNYEALPEQLILAVLDFVEFIYNHLEDYKRGDFHKYFQHDHLHFLGTYECRTDFRDEINQIFERNHINLHLTEKGRIEVRLNSILQKQIDDYEPFRQDEELNKLITTAIEKISNKRFAERTLALKELWDAFERIKTQYIGKDKRASTNELIQNVSQNDPAMIKLLNEEFQCLRNIGNSFNIRHSETDKFVIDRDDCIEYLFQRMFALIMLCLRYLD